MVGGSGPKYRVPAAADPSGSSPWGTSTEQGRSCQGRSVFLKSPAGQIPGGPGSQLFGREQREPLVAGLPWPRTRAALPAVAVARGPP